MRDARCSLLHSIIVLLTLGGVLAAATRTHTAGDAIGFGSLRPIGAQDVVDGRDLLFGDGTVAQVLRRRLAKDSSVGKAQECTHSLTNLDKCQQGTPDALYLSQQD